MNQPSDQLPTPNTTFDLFPKFNTNKRSPPNEQFSPAKKKKIHSIENLNCFLDLGGLHSQSSNTKKPKAIIYHDKVKRERETNQKRLEQRQKAIDYGKNTIGYEGYCKEIPREKRKLNNPRTPDKYQKCSKRSWDGQIRKWRRLLHQYDPPQKDEEIILDPYKQDLGTLDFEDDELAEGFCPNDDLPW